MIPRPTGGDAVMRRSDTSQDRPGECRLASGKPSSAADWPSRPKAGHQQGVG